MVPRLPEIKSSLGLSNAGLGTAIVAVPIGSLAAGPLAPRSSEDGGRDGSRPSVWPVWPCRWRWSRSRGHDRRLLMPSWLSEPATPSRMSARTRMASGCKGCSAAPSCTESTPCGASAQWPAACLVLRQPAPGSTSPSTSAPRQPPSSPSPWRPFATCLRGPTHPRRKSATRRGITHVDASPVGAYGCWRCSVCWPRARTSCRTPGRHGERLPRRRARGLRRSRGRSLHRHAGGADCRQAGRRSSGRSVRPAADSPVGGVVVAAA